MATLGFCGTLALTLAGLAVAVWTGLRARRRVHLAAVACSLACLAGTVYFAKQVGLRFDLESAGAITPLHLACARIAAACYLLPLVSGVLTLRNSRRWKRLHRVAALFTLTLTVVAAATGVTMLLLAEPL